MSEQTKEEKIMLHSDEVLEKIKKNEISEDELFTEYEQLLNNYTRLLKRYKKIIKLGDAFNTCLVNDNKDISQKARAKIMNNASEQRKLKEKMSLNNMDDKRKIKELSNNLKASMMKIELLQEKLKIRYVEKHKD